MCGLVGVSWTSSMIEGEGDLGGVVDLFVMMMVGSMSDRFSSISKSERCASLFMLKLESGFSSLSFCLSNGLTACMGGWLVEGVCSSGVVGVSVCV